jgi:hypothetical protein
LLDAGVHNVTRLAAVNGGEDLHIAVTMPLIQVGTIAGMVESVGWSMTGSSLFMWSPSIFEVMKAREHASVVELLVELWRDGVRIDSGFML